MFYANCIIIDVRRKKQICIAQLNKQFLLLADINWNWPNITYLYLYKYTPRSSKCNGWSLVTKYTTITSIDVEYMIIKGHRYLNIAYLQLLLHVN